MKTAYLNETTDIKKAACIIKKGGLVAFPTETVYGLGGDALNPESALKIYAAKGRPGDNPLIIHIADLSSLEYIACDIPDKAYDFADLYWPGPLTMILKKKKVVPKEVTAGLDSVAIRLPKHPVALSFIREAGGFVAAPSANLSGRPSPTSYTHVADDLDGRIDAIICGGRCEIGLESAIVDFTRITPVILRPGKLSAADLGLCQSTSVSHEDSDCYRPIAPGMKYRHYAPKGDLYIIQGNRQEFLEKLRPRVLADKKMSKTVGVIAYGDFLAPDGMLDYVISLDDASYGLYDALRKMDDFGANVIYCFDFKECDGGYAITDRLNKASGNKFI